ncbi:AAA family ATPase [Methylobacterium brachiatum]|jgi:predicted ATPase|uniref:AAA family ATPase n=1 Tax=Methylobacterium brachiatum TaxID=269660 RepID=UPI0024475A8E|nr:AAA family ATPase [Methylobacterium brachiatum]MDH2311956.1 AAA family ATPase [Methylobacterium brachiatum]
MLGVREVAVSGYRSLRRIGFPVDGLSVFVGGNGTGKTNLYRGLELLQAAARGTLTRELAAEGGMDSALWAGRRRQGEAARVRLSATLHEDGTGQDFAYAVEIGLVPQVNGIPTGAAFAQEPQVKTERLSVRTGGRTAVILDRDGRTGFARDEDGRKRSLGTELLPTETALGTFLDATLYPEIALVRLAMTAWRFHHAFRTDAESPLRRPCLAVTTPTLASDGSDLAALFATLAHIRQDMADLDEALDEAFPGARLVVPVPGREARFGMTVPDFPNRVFGPPELSDGTLRYLALMGALLGYRLPPFIALNEPETSLHPDLMDPLARLIARAAQRTQIWLVTHSVRLADGIASHGGARPRVVVKRDGETWIEGLRLSGDFADDADD